MKDVVVVKTPSGDEYALESGIEVPEINSRAKLDRRIKYPFSQMKRGDSFFVEKQNGDTPAKVAARLSVAASNYKHRHKTWKYTVRQFPPHKPTGARLWRL